MRTIRIAVLALAVTLFPIACGGGGGGGGGDGKTPKSDQLALIDVNVADFAAVPINTILELEFNSTLKASSVRPDTVRIRQGPDFGLQAHGELRLDGNKVLFFPQLPVRSDLTDAGLQPGSAYQIELPGLPGAAVLRTEKDDPLVRSYVERFFTAAESGALFTDNFLDPGPAAVMEVTPLDAGADVPTDDRIVLTFNRRALHPATVNASTVYVTLVERNGRNYQRRIQGEPRLIQEHGSVAIEFAPRFALADRAVYRIDVSRGVQDLLGFDVEPFTSTFSTADEAAKPGELVLDFTAEEASRLADPDASTAAWGEVKDGELTATFTAAGGTGTAGDLTPTLDVEYSADDFPGGVTVEFVDGVEADLFHFRSIDIPEGVQVRFVRRPGGPNRPIVLLSLKDIRIDGTLVVAGGDGDDGELAGWNSSQPLHSGGRAGPGGTDGADSYTGTGARFAPAQDADAVAGGPGGGSGGTVSGHSNLSWSGGGGGGGSRLAGTDGDKGRYTFTASYNGKGGPGGEASSDRTGISNLERAPNLGGAGGGAGGPGYYYPSLSFRNWRQAPGAGGGAGGAITLQGAADLIIGETGAILAAGGRGGDVSNHSSYYGGAGGGGGGGSVKLLATGKALLLSGAEIDVAGGPGGKFTNSFTRYLGGEGGDGGEGFIRIAAGEDEVIPDEPRIEGINDATLTYQPVSTGLFRPVGGGAPSFGQTLWLDLGVFDAEFSPPEFSDISAVYLNDEIDIEVQMAVEDEDDFTVPDLAVLDQADDDSDGETDDTLDPARLSEWVPLNQIESLNGLGYRFVRVRVRFQLDPFQGPNDLLPHVDRLRLPFTH